MMAPRLIGALVVLLLVAGVETTLAQDLGRDFSLDLPLFRSDSAWNQTVTGAEALPESDEQILALYRVLLGDTTSLSPSGYGMSAAWPYIDVSSGDYSTAIFRLGSGSQTVVMRDYDGNVGANNPKLPAGPDQTVSVPAPAGAIRPAGPQETGADGLMVLYDPQAYTAYDYWQPTTAVDASGQSLGGGQEGTRVLEAGTIDYFDVQGSGANPAGYWSASASGVPLLGGLLLPEDIESGAIGHALAFAIPCPRNTNQADPAEPYSRDYQYPASTTEGEYYNTDPYALASGQRIRLKPTIVDPDGQVIDETTLAPITRLFLAALRTYGAYLRDNALGFSFYAEDYHTAVLNVGDDQVNYLIGQPASTPLATGKTRWQIVMDKLNSDLEAIPLAAGPWQAGQDPAQATMETANFEVVAPATAPADYALAASDR